MKKHRARTPLIRALSITFFVFVTFAGTDNLGLKAFAAQENDESIGKDIPYMSGSCNGITYAYYPQKCRIIITKKGGDNGDNGDNDDEIVLNTSRRGPANKIISMGLTKDFTRGINGHNILIIGGADGSISRFDIDQSIESE
ncbi:MAG: hypothetical protein HQK53_04555 [Oligoflexia bacterium]|nr:hypothetical protein [Oligoflexia bacterium]